MHAWRGATARRCSPAAVFNIGGLLLSTLVGQTAASFYRTAASVLGLLAWVLLCAGVLLRCGLTAFSRRHTAEGSSRFIVRLADISGMGSASDCPHRTPSRSPTQIVDLISRTYARLTGPPYSIGCHACRSQLSHPRPPRQVARSPAPVALSDVALVLACSGQKAVMFVHH
jgi:hypothetical protein